MSEMNCKTCTRGACAYAGIKTRKRKAELEQRAAECTLGYKTGPGKVNRAGHKVTEKSVFDDFTPPTPDEIAKADRQDAYLKRGRI